MDIQKQKLLIEQTDRKMDAFKSLKGVIVPPNGWVNTIRKIFTWNKVNLNSPGESRSIYLNALREADKGNINPLIEFART